MKFDDIKEKIKDNKLIIVFREKPKKQKILIVAALAILIVAAAVITTLSSRSNYVVLFSDVSEEEASTILSILENDGVDYSYSNGGNIMVDETVADQERANLAIQGYPKSGFTYDIYTTNAGGLTTDSEKETYKLYELQDRIGATIQLFDGVKTAKVTIALKEEKKYAIEGTSDDANTSTASVVVTMKDGGSPSDKQARAIQRLVARSVPNLEMENVAVFDGNGIEVSSSNDNGATATQEVAQMIEDQLSNKVINILGPIYGSENIRVSAKGKVNMEKVVTETITYSTPEKIDENDKSGIVSHEELTNENSSGGYTAGGVAGSETNADTSEYTSTTTGNGATYNADSQVRDYLVNQIRTQGQIDPGVLEDVTISVVIHGNDLGALTENEVIALIANSTGISLTDQATKITVVNAPFYEEATPATPSKVNLLALIKDNWLIALIIGGILLVLLVVLTIILKKKRKKKKKLKKAAAQAEADRLFAQMTAQQEEEANSPEMLSMKSARSKELRDTIREFADENPEISAAMLKLWLNGGEGGAGKSEG